MDVKDVKNMPGQTDKDETQLSEQLEQIEVLNEPYEKAPFAQAVKLEPPTKKGFGLGLFKSMGIAYKNLFRKKITVQYPHERLEIPERARWAVEHKFYEDGMPKCTACGICERACPDFVIKISSYKGDEGAKRIGSYRYAIGACMMCGLCVEACPFDAIQMGKNYELARFNPDELMVNLLEDVPAADPKARAAAEKAKKEAAELNQTTKSAEEGER